MQYVDVRILREKCHIWISRRTYMHDPWTWTIVRGLPEGGEGG